MHPGKKKKPVKKPIDETNRTPNSPWQLLYTMEPEQNGEDNDINFDVDENFKFRMPTGDNFKERDVKFNVQLPKDLLGAKPQKATPSHPTVQPRSAQS